MRALSYCTLVLLLAACGQPPRDAQLPAFVELTDSAKRELVNAPASFTLHPGLEIQTFAGEPLLTNPTNIDVDERGRVWVCTAQNYRRFNHDHPEKSGGDEILILEDTDGDGSADARTVFYKGEDVNAALGIAKLGDKVYVAASPHMLVFTDADGDDVPEMKDTLFTGLKGVDHDHGLHAIVFGPDGKLYFNFGNEGQQLLRKDGKPVLDTRGRAIREGDAFRQGMIVRCNADGSDPEVLAHNFRNNYELAVDGFGGMWQSDNDDDGNRGVRINYVMDYGNYGYKDAITGASWQTDRIGQHPEVPKRHWHLNDPGVVPNLLQTGAGSPTGMLVYEGTQLPKQFHGQMIHCEPGHNVVRSYPTVKDGAGYTAEIVPLLKSEDKWFRPSDVCAAPDGSLLIADWYDSGVGGHLMGDIQRGRIYRLHAEERGAYVIPRAAPATPKGTVAALSNPNQAVRYLAWRKLSEDETFDVPAIERILTAVDDLPTKSRLAWLIAAKGSPEVAYELLAGSDDDKLQETALRLARQYPGPDHGLLLQAIERGATSRHPGVWREAAIGLRFLKGQRADRAWVDLAGRYDGKDRWYLEALGIGADLHAEDRFAAWLAAEPDYLSPAGRRIVWRSRSANAPGLYPELIDATQDSAELASLFRGLHFHDEANARRVLERAVDVNDHPRKHAVIQYALTATNENILKASPHIRSRVTELIPQLRGTDTWLTMVSNNKLAGEVPYLLDHALRSTDVEFQSRAARIIDDMAGVAPLRAAYAKADAPAKDAILNLARFSKGRSSEQWLKEIRTDGSVPVRLRNRATRSLANYWNGVQFLLEEVEGGELPLAEAEYIARVLSQSQRPEQRDAAIAWLAEHRTSGPIDMNAALAVQGDLAHGRRVYGEYCAACHVAQHEGVRYGPDLSVIGDKLGKDALLSAIAYPSQGIGFGYEGFTVKTGDGKTYTGYIESQTENELFIRMMGGVTTKIEKRNITEKEELDASLMTAGLLELMEQQDVADLLAYLEQLRATQPSR